MSARVSAQPRIPFADAIMPDELAKHRGKDAQQDQQPSRTSRPIRAWMKPADGALELIRVALAVAQYRQF